MLIAQITDLHIRAPGTLAYGRVDTAGALRRCVDALNGLDPQPDLILATGDLVDLGEAVEYAHLRSLLAPLSAPVYLLPGNHDDRDALRVAFPDHAYLPVAGPIHYTIDHLPARLIGLDSTIPGKPHGALGPDSLDWLAARLREGGGRPTLIFVHHPPFPTGIEHMDVMNLRDSGVLAEVIRRYPEVARLIAGHVHRPVHTVWAGVAASTCPSPAHSIALDLRPDGPVAFTIEPPFFHLHLWRPETGFVTHAAPVGPVDGPHVLYENVAALREKLEWQD